jgi:hypothetical protein
VHGVFKTADGKVAAIANNVGLPQEGGAFERELPNELRIPDAPRTAGNIKCFESFRSDTGLAEVIRKCGLAGYYEENRAYHKFLHDMEDESVVVIGSDDLKHLDYINHVDTNGATRLLH